MREAPINRTIANIERAGVSLGWSGWEIPGAQAASILLFANMPDLQADRDLSDCELRQFGRRLASALRERTSPPNAPDRPTSAPRRGGPPDSPLLHRLALTDSLPHVAISPRPANPDPTGTKWIDNSR